MSNGARKIEGAINIDASDIQIGAVEIKNATTDDRMTVAADGRAATDANLQIGNADAPGGSGVVTAATPRMCLATDVALPTGTNSLGGVKIENAADATRALVSGAAPAEAANGLAVRLAAPAHDSAISGSPLRTGCHAVSANPAAVATGDVANHIGTLIGVPVVRPHAIPEAEWSHAGATSGIVNTTTAVTIRAAQAAGIRNYLTSLQIATDTLGAATELAVMDGAGGTVLWRGKLQTGPLAQMTIVFSNPLKGTAATLLEVATLTAVTGGVYVNAQGYSAP